MWKSGSSFAEIVKKTGSGGGAVNPFMRNANENVSKYVARIKNEMTSTRVTGPFKVFNLSRNGCVLVIAARNEYVAKVIAVTLAQAKNAQIVKSDEARYVNFAISDSEESYQLGIVDDMDLAEATQIAQRAYRASTKTRIDPSADWIRASVVQTNTVQDTEGQVLL